MNAFDNIEKSLLHLYSLPHNVRPGVTPIEAVRKTMAEIRSGLSGIPKEETYIGPKLFFRVCGANNAAYAGQRWFDASILDNLQKAYTRIYFREADRKAVIRDMLREVLAVSTEWNKIEEVWALELPPGAKLVGYSGLGSPQRLFANQPLSAAGNRMLVGRVVQIFFPVKNPL